MFGIRSKTEEVDSLCTSIIDDIDDNRKPYTKTITYMKDSITFSIKTVLALSECSKHDIVTYSVILNILSKNSNIVNITRTELKDETGGTDSAISRSIKKLESLGLIDVIDRDRYRIPLDVAYKGNLTKMIKEWREEQERIEREENEKAARESIRALSIKRSAKLKIKEN